MDALADASSATPRGAGSPPPPTPGLGPRTFSSMIWAGSWLRGMGACRQVGWNPGVDAC